MLRRILEQWTTAIWLFVFNSMLTIRYSYGRVAHIGQQRISVLRNHGIAVIISGGVIRLGISERMTSGLQVMDRVLNSHLIKVMRLLIKTVSQHYRVKAGLYRRMVLMSSHQSMTQHRSIGVVNGECRRRWN